MRFYTACSVDAQTAYLPVQVVLFPVNPDLHVQSYEPSVFTHSVLLLQSAVSASHSLMSKLKQNEALRASQVVEILVSPSVC